MVVSVEYKGGKRLRKSGERYKQAGGNRRPIKNKAEGEQRVSSKYGCKVSKATNRPIGIPKTIRRAVGTRNALDDAISARNRSLR